jgi:hypothetical protein
MMAGALWLVLLGKFFRESNHEDECCYGTFPSHIGIPVGIPTVFHTNEPPRF